MIVNFCNSLQFRTRLYINGSILDQVQSTKLLGVIISDDLSWHQNTQELCKKANKRMIILRKLREFDVSTKDMLTIYVLYKRGTLEQSSVVWSTALTKAEEYAFERIQKIALKIILQSEYITYENALKLTNLPTIKARHNILLQKFALKCVKDPKTSYMFPFAPQKFWARKSETFQVPMAKTERYYRSAIPQMARLLNTIS